MNAFTQAWNSFFLKENFGPRNPSTEEESYGGVPPDEHPLYGKEGFRGSEKKKPLPSIRDPKLVTQEKFDENKPTLDTSTPPNPFSKAWNFLKADPEMQIAGRGTAPPSIRGMMGRRRQLFTPEQMTPQPLDRQGRPHTHEEYMEGPRGVETPQRFEPTPEWFTHQREEPQGKEVSGRPLTDVSRPVEPFR